MIVNRGAGKGAALKRKKCITYVDCSRADEDTVTRWVYATLKRAGVASDVQACRNVAAYCLCDMSRVEGETQKLIEYGASPVTAAVVDELVYKDADYRVYEMTDAIAARNYSRFLSVCAELTRRSSDKNMVVSALHKYFKNLLVISTSDAGTARLAEALKMPEFAVKRSADRARAIGRERLKYYVDSLYAFSARMRSGRLTADGAFYSSLAAVLFG